MPVVTIEQTSAYYKTYQIHMYNTNKSRKEDEWIYLQTMIRSENW